MNICKRQTFIGKKYLRILFYIASASMKPIRVHFGKLLERRTEICILAKFEGQKYAF